MKTTKILFFLLLAVCVFAQSAQELYNEGNRRFLSHNYALAESFFQRLLNEHPYSEYVPDTQFQLAMIYYNQQNYEAAQRQLELVERRYRSTRFRLQLLFWYGASLYQQGHWQRAYDSFDMYLETDDTNYRGEAALFSALCALELEDLETAKISLLQLREQQSLDAGAEVILASLFYKSEEYEDLSELLESADFSEYEGHEKARMDLYRAELFFHAQDYDRAYELYTGIHSTEGDVIAVKYQRLFVIYQQRGQDEELNTLVLAAERDLSGKRDVLSDFYLHIAVNAFRQEKYDLSLSYFRRILNAYSLAAVAELVPLYVADIYYQQSLADRAVKLLKDFKEAAGGSEAVNFQLAAYVFKQKNWADSEALLSSFIETYLDSPYYIQARYLYAYSLYKLGDYAKAVSVMDRSFEEARTGVYAADMLKLRAMCHVHLGDLDKAVSSLDEYIYLRPEDTQQQINRARYEFELRRYRSVIQRASTLTALSDEKDDRILVAYMLGLSHVSEQNYTDAIEYLGDFSSDAVASSQHSDLSPFWDFYLGWSYYRMSQFRNAVAVFSRLDSLERTNPLSLKAVYLKGWAQYSLGEYFAAATAFSQYGRNAAASDADKGFFMLAKSLVDGGNVSEGLEILEDFLEKFPRSSYADDALFEYANTLMDTKQYAQASEAFSRLHTQYPQSDFAELSLFNVAVALYNTDTYTEARDAYNQYRRSYENGRLYDAALFWGGMAARDAGEAFQAILLWQILINSHTGSSFRPNAMYQSALAYEETGEYRKVITLLTDLMALYPQDAAAFQADSFAERIRYLLLGQSAEEAELSAIISQEGAAATARGRKAMVDLARLYILDTSNRREVGYSMLNEVLKKQSEDAENASWAQYYIGEYWYRRGNVEEAAKAFFSAATMTPADGDFVAQSLFKAAEMALLAGNSADASGIIQRLESRFPGSTWAAEGRRLLEER